MTDLKISELEDGGSSQAADAIPIARSGQNYYVTSQYLKNFVFGSNGTISIAAGKTFSVNNTITLNGNDGVSVNFGSGGTFLYSGGALGTPSSGTMTNVTGLPLTTGVTGTLPVANGGTGITSFGTGVAGALGVSVGSAGAFVVNGGALGTPSSGTLTNATGLPLTTGVTGTLPVANGGTGITSFGTGVATAFSQNVTGSGGIVLATSPTLTTPTLGVASATSVNKVTITAPATSATLSLANGSTLATSGAYSVTLAATGPTSVTLPTSGTVASSTSKLSDFASTTSAELRTVISDKTGTEALVFANTPTLVTPILGTPTSVTLTNATGLPISTGVDGLGSGVATFLATPTSTNLRSVVTDETGSGSLVFGTSPTIATPVITGTATFNGATSGAVTLRSPAVAGTTTFQLPSSNGTSGYVLVTDGLGNTSWASSGGAAGNAAGVNKNIQFNDATVMAGAGSFNFDKTTNTVTLGVTSSTTGTFALANASSANTVSLKSGNNSAAWTLTLPTSAGTAGQVLSTDGTGVASWSNFSGSYGTLTDGATITWNTDLYPHAQVVINGNRTLSITGTFAAGKEYYLHVIQGAAGGYSLTWDNRVQFEDQDYLTTDEYNAGLEQTAYSSTLYKFYSDGYYLYAEEAKRYPPLYTVFSDFSLPLNDFTTLTTTTSMPSGGSVSRNGQAMVYDSTGKLTYAPNNVLTYSNDFTNGDWLKTGSGGGSAPTVTGNYAAAPDGTTTAARVQCALNSGTTTSYISWVSRNSIGYVGNNIFSIWLKSNTGSSYTMYLRVGGGISQITVTTSWQRFYVTVSNGDGTSLQGPTFGIRGGQTPTNSDSVDILAWGALLENVTYQATPSGTYYTNYPNPTTTAAYYGPRFDYDPSTLAAKGLLIEGTRTNLVTYSQDFTNAAWSKANGTASATSAIAPDGTATANLFTTAASTALTAIVRASSTSITAGAVYTTTIYVKNNGIQYLSVTFDDAATTNGVYTVFDIANGTITRAATVYGTGAAGYSSITSVGNGWYRLTLTGTSGTVATLARTAICPQPNGTSQFASFVGNGTSGFYVYGAQTELGAFPTSYIPTVASSVARAAETFSITGYTNRLLEAYYIDEQTNVSSSLPETVVSSGAVTISPPTFGWVTSLRAYTNAYAGSIASPSWLSFSRSGNAMVTDSTGALTFAPNNLLLNTATLSTQTVTTGIIPSCDVLLSFKGTGSVAISGGYTGTLAGTGASTLVSLKFTTTTASLTFTVTGSVTEAQLERVTYSNRPSLYVANTGSQYYGPRYDYDASTVPATPRGLLIEESRANLVLQSQTFDNASWTKTALNTTGTPAWVDVAIAPDGTQTADKLIANTTNATHLSVQTLSVTSGSSYVLSAYIKASGETTASLVVTNSPFPRVKFNLTTGAVISSSGATGTITSTGNGWYRCAIVFTAPAASINAGVAVRDIDANWTGNDIDGIFVWGAQLEAGAFATSYIPTTTASVTRAADVAGWTSAAFSSYWNASAGSLAVETTIGGGTAATYPYAVAFAGSNVNTDSIGIAWTASSGSVRPSIRQAGTNQYATALITVTAGSTFKSSIGWATNNVNAAVNGTLSTLVTTSTLPTITQFLIGQSAGYQPQYNGWIRSLAYYNQRLPDAILKQKSAINAPY